MKNTSQHSPETLARMRANSEAAKRRLARLNSEYRVRQQAHKHAPLKTNPATFGEAISRAAEEADVVL